MTDNEKYIKRGHTLIIGDDPHGHEEVAGRDKAPQIEPCHSVIRRDGHAHVRKVR